MSDTPQTTSESTTPVPKKKKRWWLRILLGIVGLIILLILLAPTIASMGFVRSIVLGKVNDNLNGKVALEDLSLGWFSSTRLGGLTVTDAAGKKIVSLDKVTAGITVLDVVKGNFNLGDVVIDGLHIDLVVDEKGKSNLDNLAKASPQSASASAPPPSAPSTPSTASKPAPSKLPNISGTITLTNSSATVQKADLPETLAVDLKGNIKIPDINSPIQNAIDIALKIGNSPAGAISLTGNVSAIKNNLVLEDLGQMTVDEKLSIQGIVLAALKPFLPPTIDTLEGRIDGDIQAKLDKGGTVDGKIVTTNLVVHGQALAGDTYKTSSLVLLLPKIAVVPQTGAISVGADQGADPIQLTFDQGSVSLRALTTPQMLQNLSAMAAPGASGMVRTDVKLDLAKLASQLPHALHTIPEVQIQSADLIAYEDIQMTAQQAVIKQHFELPNGIKGQNSAPHAPVQINPLVFESTVTDLGKVGTQAIPDIRDFHLLLTSAFASADFQGKTLGAINGKASGDFAKLKSELGQVVNMGDIDMKGTFDATVTTNGDLTSNAPVDLTAALTLHDLQISSAAKPLINQPWMNASIGGKLSHDQANITAANKLIATVRTGNEQSPTIDVYAVADVSLSNGLSANFELQKLNVDLVKAQTEFAALLGQGGATIRSGTFSATAKGKYDGQTATIDSFKASPANITVEHNGATILKDYATQLDLGTTTINPKTKQISIASFSIDDSNRLLTVHTTQGSPITVSIPATGLPAASAKLDLIAHLAPMMAVADAFKPPSTQPAKDIHWTSGTLTSQIALSTDNAGIIKLDPLTFSAPDLAFTRGDASYKADPINLSTAVTLTPIAGNLENIDVQKLSLQSGFATVSLSQPIAVKNLSSLLASLGAGAQAVASSAGSASGGIHVAADIAKLKAFLDAFQGSAPGQSGTASGTLDLTEGFSTQGAAIAFTGGGNVTNLSVQESSSTPPFTESSVKITNDVTLDHSKDSLTIKTVAISMESSKALDVSLNGAVQSLSTTRQIQNVVLNLNYDMGKLWQIARPFLPPDQQKRTANYTISGTQQRQITVSGSYPAGKEFPDAIKSLIVHGGVGVGNLKGEGLDVQQFGQPFTLENGILTLGVNPAVAQTPATSQPASAIVNGGSLNLAGTAINLSSPKPLLNVTNLALVKDVQLNPILAQNFLKFSPLFAGADQAAGTVTVNIASARDLSVTDLTSDKSGTAELSLDIANVQLLNKMLSQLTQFIGGGNNAFTGHIYSKQLSFSNGVVNQHIIFQIGQYPLEFQGGVGLKNLDLRDFTILIPGELLAKIPKYGSALSNLKGGIPIKLTGTATDPHLPSLPQFVADVVKRNVTDNPLGAVQGLFNKPAPQSNNQQQAAPSNNATDTGIGALENLLGGGNKNNNPPPAQKNNSNAQRKAATKPTTKPANPLRGLFGR